jgi:hypothetical protein
MEQLREIPIEREDGTMRVLVSQMGGCASMETREIKIATERLICKYDINVCTFMELNFNWTKVNSSENLASWFQEEEMNYALLVLTTRGNSTKYLANTSQEELAWCADTNFSNMPRNRR